MEIGGNWWNFYEKGSAAYSGSVGLVCWFKIFCAELPIFAGWQSSLQTRPSLFNVHFAYSAVGDKFLQTLGAGVELQPNCDRRRNIGTD